MNGYNIEYKHKPHKTLSITYLKTEKNTETRIYQLFTILPLPTLPLPNPLLPNPLPLASFSPPFCLVLSEALYQSFKHFCSAIVENKIQNLCLSRLSKGFISP
jgi:hypothetical protein